MYAILFQKNVDFTLKLMPTNNINLGSKSTTISAQPLTATSRRS